MEFKKKFIGIDLATRIENSALFVIGEDAGKKLKIIYESTEQRAVGSAMPFIFDKIWDLELRYPSDETVIAIDIPFGYPANFVDWVSNFDLKSPEKVELSLLKFRKTERWLETYAKKFWKVSGLTGLSVSMDKLGVTFTVGADLISEMINALSFTASMGDRPKSAKTIIEVYPKASLMSWFHSSKDIVRKYRGSESDRKVLANRLIGKFGDLFEPLALEGVAFCNDHHIDSFVAAMTARTYADNECVLPAVTLPSNEGWIWIPK